MSFFKAYDVRGTVPEELNETVVSDIAAAFIAHISSIAPLTAPPVIVVGRDNRASSESFSKSVIDTLVSYGATVIDIGLSPTPMFYYGVTSLGADGGIMITASHNPPQYNGLKMVSRDARPIGQGSGMEDIEARYGAHDFLEKSTGTVMHKTIVEAYIADALARVPAIDPSSLRVAVDTGNGVSVVMVEEYFKHLPCALSPLYFEMDGTFPHHMPDPLKSENVRDLGALVREKEAHLGIALDADGDRVVFLDENGSPIASDIITALVGAELLKSHVGATIMYDLRSSHIVPELITGLGGRAMVTRVGHAFIKKTMRENNGLFAGELSGHFYFQEVGYFEAPLLVISIILNILSGTEKRLSEIIAPLQKYFVTGEINFTVSDKDACIARLKEHCVDAMITELDGVTIEYPEWWCNVRPSNTEPLLRLNLEANTAALRDQQFATISAIIQS